jgi:hypothetical protein
MSDLLYALRMLARNRGLTVVALTTLALGIGTNAAIFSVVDTVVFRPLPYKDTGRLVKIWTTPLGKTDDVSFPDFADIRDQNDVFQQIAADDGTEPSMVLKQVLSESMKITLAGLVIGAIGAQALTRFLSSLLFGVSTTDAVTYLGVSSVLAFVALLASYVPARRATKIDPRVALREE